MPASPGHKICCQISGRKKYQQFLVRKYAGNFESVTRDRNKMSGNSGQKKCLQVRTEKKRWVFLGGKKIAGKPAIASELNCRTYRSVKNIRPRMHSQSYVPDPAWPEFFSTPNFFFSGKNCRHS